MAAITPSERRELRLVVRSQFKVSMTDVALRKQKLLAGVEARLAARYRQEDETANAFRRRTLEIKRKADAEYRELVTEFDELFSGGKWSRGSEGFQPPSMYRKSEDRAQLRQAMVSGIEAWAKRATLQLERGQADLLLELAIDGLTTERAQEFLSKILSGEQLIAQEEPWMREISAEVPA